MGTYLLAAPSTSAGRARARWIPDLHGPGLHLGGLGFREKGQGGPFIGDRQSRIGGTVAVNVDGDLKAKGHLIGATGSSGKLLLHYEALRPEEAPSGP